MGHTDPMIDLEKRYTDDVQKMYIQHVSIALVSLLLDYDPFKSFVRI